MPQIDWFCGSCCNKLLNRLHVRAMLHVLTRSRSRPRLTRNAAVAAQGLSQHQGLQAR
jgi:hypothetical protein